MKLYNNWSFNYCHQNIHNKITYNISSCPTLIILYNKSCVLHVVAPSRRPLPFYNFFPLFFLLCHVAHYIMYIKIINI